MSPNNVFFSCLWWKYLRRTNCFKSIIWKAKINATIPVWKHLRMIWWVQAKLGAFPLSLCSFPEDMPWVSGLWSLLTFTRHLRHQTVTAYTNFLHDSFHPTGRSMSLLCWMFEAWHGRQSDRRSLMSSKILSAAPPSFAGNVLFFLTSPLPLKCIASA